MQFQLNENVSGFYICPCPFRRYPPLWGRLGIVEDNAFKVAVESTTNAPTRTGPQGRFFVARNPVLARDFARACPCCRVLPCAGFRPRFDPLFLSLLQCGARTSVPWHKQNHQRDKDLPRTGEGGSWAGLEQKSSTRTRETACLRGIWMARCLSALPPPARGDEFDCDRLLGTVTSCSPVRALPPTAHLLRPSCTGSYSCG